MQQGPLSGIAVAGVVHRLQDGGIGLQGPLLGAGALHVGVDRLQAPVLGVGRLQAGVVRLQEPVAGVGRLYVGRLQVGRVGREGRVGVGVLHRGMGPGAGALPVLGRRGKGIPPGLDTDLFPTRFTRYTTPPYRTSGKSNNRVKQRLKPRRTYRKELTATKLTLAEGECH